MLLQVIPRPGQRWAEFRRNQLMLGMSARDRLLQMVEARRAQTAAQATPGLFSEAAPTMPGLFGGGVQVNPAAGVPTRDAAGEPAPMLASGQGGARPEFLEALAMARRAEEFHRQGNRAEAQRLRQQAEAILEGVGVSIDPIRGGVTLAGARVEEVGIPGVDLGPRSTAEIREEHGQHPKLDLPGRPYRDKKQGSPMDRFFDRLFGLETIRDLPSMARNYGQIKEMRNHVLLQMGLQIMEASGPSLEPRSLGQILALGIGKAQQEVAATVPELRRSVELQIAIREATGEDGELDLEKLQRVALRFLEQGQAESGMAVLDYVKVLKELGPDAATWKFVSHPAAGGMWVNEATQDVRAVGPDGRPGRAISSDELVQVEEAAGNLQSRDLGDRIEYFHPSRPDVALHSVPKVPPPTFEPREEPTDVRREAGVVGTLAREHESITQHTEAATITSTLIGRVPVVGRKLTGTEDQELDRASGAFVTAVIQARGLRMNDETRRAIRREFIPLASDSPEVRRRKFEAREAFIRESLERGRVGGQTPSAAPEAAPAAGTTGADRLRSRLRGD